MSLTDEKIRASVDKSQRNQVDSGSPPPKNSSSYTVDPERLYSNLKSLGGSPRAWKRKRPSIKEHKNFTPSELKAIKKLDPKRYEEIIQQM